MADNPTNNAAGAQKKERKPRGPAQKRPVYLVYSIENDELVIHASTRKAEEVLEAAAGTGRKYVRIEV